MAENARSLQELVIAQNHSKMVVIDRSQLKC